MKKPKRDKFMGTLHHKDDKIDIFKIAKMIAETEQDKKDFKFCAKAQITILEKMNDGYSENIELFKALIDINLETIEQLKMLI